MVRRFLIAASCLVWAASAQAQLPATVTAALASAGIPESAIGVVVQPLDAAKPQLTVNANAALNPASTMKLLTTYAALDLLGPAYTWQTEVWAAAPPRDGVLDGDLFIKGGGDPKLTYEQFWRLLKQTRDTGLREVLGDLVLDRSAFAIDATPPGKFDGQPLRPYNVPPDALLLNFNAITLTLAAGAKNEVRVSAEPLPANLTIVNKLTANANATSCGDWRNALNAELVPETLRNRLVLTGSYPTICGEQFWNMAPMPADAYVFGVFKTLWTETGGRFGSSKYAGRVREGNVPENAYRIAVLPAPTLGEMVRDINKYSNNVMARQLLLTLGMNAGKAPARTSDGEAVIRAWLAARNLNIPELVIDNGAGLSRHERLSAASLVALLRSAWGSAVMPELMASLPLVAVDGTMKKRLKENGISGQAHIKTGSLEGVKSMAGYVLDQNGRRWALAFLINHPNAAQGRAAQDALLEWVYAGGK